jgi:hypothetical protein
LQLVLQLTQQLVAVPEMVVLAEVDLLADLVVVLLAMADHQELVRRRLHLMQQLQQVSILLETQVEPQIRMVRVVVVRVQLEAVALVVLEKVIGE